MVVKINWTKTLIASGVLAVAAACAYFIYKTDEEDEKEPEEETYKQDYNPPVLSTSRADKMTRKECFELLKKIASSQEETKKLMADLVDDLIGKKLKHTLGDVYERVMAGMPSDPLESSGLTLFDLDHVVDRYQNDPAIRDCILTIMNSVPHEVEEDDQCISTEELIKIHEFMLTEIEGIVSSYKKLPHRESMDKKALTLTLQSIISAKVQEKFGYNYSLVDKSILKNHSELSMNTKFARLTMQMQSEMSEMTG